MELRVKVDKEKSAYALLLNNPGTSLTSEKILWLHVIAQLLLDITSRRKDIKGDVVEWMATEDFEIVCDMAGLDPVYMHRLFSALGRDRNKKRAFKKAMEFRFLLRTYVESNIGEIDKR